MKDALLKREEKRGKATLQKKEMAVTTDRPSAATRGLQWDRHVLLLTKSAVATTTAKPELASLVGPPCLKMANRLTNDKDQEGTAWDCAKHCCPNDEGCTSFPCGLVSQLGPPAPSKEQLSQRQLALTWMHANTHEAHEDSKGGAPTRGKGNVSGFGRKEIDTRGRHVLTSPFETDSVEKRQDAYIDFIYNTPSDMAELREMAARHEVGIRSTYDKIRMLEGPQGYHVPELQINLQQLRLRARNELLHLKGHYGDGQGCWTEVLVRLLDPASTADMLPHYLTDAKLKETFDWSMKREAERRRRTTTMANPDRSREQVNGSPPYVVVPPRGKGHGRGMGRAGGKGKQRETEPVACSLPTITATSSLSATSAAAGRNAGAAGSSAPPSRPVSTAPPTLPDPLTSNSFAVLSDPAQPTNQATLSANRTAQPEIQAAQPTAQPANQTAQPTSQTAQPLSQIDMMLRMSSARNAAATAAKTATTPSAGARRKHEQTEGDAAALEGMTTPNAGGGAKEGSIRKASRSSSERRADAALDLFPPLSAAEAALLEEEADGLLGNAKSSMSVDHEAASLDAPLPPGTTPIRGIAGTLASVEEGKEEGELNEENGEDGDLIDLKDAPTGAIPLGTAMPADTQAGTYGGEQQNNTFPTRAARMVAFAAEHARAMAQQAAAGAGTSSAQPPPAQPDVQGESMAVPESWEEYADAQKP